MVDPTPEELRAIEAGEAEIARGAYVTLDELKHDLATQDRKKRQKEISKGFRDAIASELLRLLLSSPTTHTRCMGFKRYNGHAPLRL